MSEIREITGDFIVIVDGTGHGQAIVSVDDLGLEVCDIFTVRGKVLMVTDRIFHKDDYCCYEYTVRQMSDFELIEVLDILTI